MLLDNDISNFMRLLGITQSTNVKRYEDYEKRKFQHQRVSNGVNLMLRAQNYKEREKLQKHVHHYATRSFNEYNFDLAAYATKHRLPV